MDRVSRVDHSGPENVVCRVSCRTSDRCNAPTPFIEILRRTLADVQGGKLLPRSARGTGYQEVAGSLVENKVTARICSRDPCDPVAGGFGLCPRRSKHSSSYLVDARGHDLYGKRKHHSGALSPAFHNESSSHTSSFWSVGVNAGAGVVDSAECGSPEWRCC